MTDEDLSMKFTDEDWAQDRVRAEHFAMLCNNQARAILDGAPRVSTADALAVAAQLVAARSIAASISSAVVAGSNLQAERIDELIKTIVTVAVMDPGLPGERKLS